MRSNYKNLYSQIVILIVKFSDLLVHEKLYFKQENWRLKIKIIQFIEIQKKQDIVRKNHSLLLFYFYIILQNFSSMTNLPESDEEF